MNLTDFRDRLDILDKDLLQLFVERMGIVAQVADFKRQEGLPITTPSGSGRSWPCFQSRCPRNCAATPSGCSACCLR